VGNGRRPGGGGEEVGGGIGGLVDRNRFRIGIDSRVVSSFMHLCLPRPSHTRAAEVDSLESGSFRPRKTVPPAAVERACGSFDWGFAMHIPHGEAHITSCSVRIRFTFQILDQPWRVPFLLSPPPCIHLCMPHYTHGEKPTGEYLARFPMDTCIALSPLLMCGCWTSVLPGTEDWNSLKLGERSRGGRRGVGALGCW